MTPCVDCSLPGWYRRVGSSVETQLGLERPPGDGWEPFTVSVNGAPPRLEAWPEDEDDE